MIDPKTGRELMHELYCAHCGRYMGNVINMNDLAAIRAHRGAKS